MCTDINFKPSVYLSVDFIDAFLAIFYIKDVHSKGGKVGMLGGQMGSILGRIHGITKYGTHSLTQITLAMDKELTNWQDSAPDWLIKCSRQHVICIYRQRTN